MRASGMVEKHSRPVSGGRGVLVDGESVDGGEGSAGVAGGARGHRGARRGFAGSAAGGLRAERWPNTDADLGYPVILASDGRLMDGGHRVARAWLEGLDEVDAGKRSGSRSIRNRTGWCPPLREASARRHVSGADRGRLFVRARGGRPPCVLDADLGPT